ncbi:NAD(P)-dependent alcohol dehydrogenase [Sporobolomyces salmoneus]|uniref:NAD(P)-dependent alcohol dehydrogenase n=1 Tax=Sporobolomyces salmoneus TaxID=183962 RepID=UPI003174E9A5
MSAPPQLGEDLTVPSGKTQTAFVVRGIDDVAFEERPLPAEPGPDDVVVAPKSITLCGSDNHYISHGRIGDFIVEKPMVLGHETAAVVTKLGKNLTNLKVGQRVALEPGKSCRVCSDCKSGYYNRCSEMVFAATPPFDGTLTSFYTLPADLCYPLPDNMSLEEGALIEPMSVAIHAVHKVAQMQHAANVLVFGAGPVGLLTCAVAKGLGARQVIAVDVQESRLKFAKEQGLAYDYYVSPKANEGESRMDYSKRCGEDIRKRFGFDERGPGGLDLVVDCSGAEVCVQTGIFALRHGGTLITVGMGAPEITLPVHLILVKELTIKGSFRYGAGCYRLALDLVARGAVNLKALISHRYAFKDAKLAFEANKAGKGQDGKPLTKAVIFGPTDEDSSLVEKK